MERRGGVTSTCEAHKRKHPKLVLCPCTKSQSRSCADSLVVSTQHSEYVGAEFGFRLDVMTEIVGNETFMSIITAKQEGGRTTMDLLCFDPDIDVSGIKKELTFDEPPRLV